MKDLKFTSWLLLSSSIFLISCGGEETIQPHRAKSIVESVYASGTIIPKNEHNVFSLIGGTILKKYVKDGDTVKKGQILYEISSDAPSARVNSAKAAYQKSSSDASSNSSILSDLSLLVENAQAKCALDSAVYFKYKKMRENDAISQLQVDQAKLQYTVSANAVKSAKEKYQAAKRDAQVILSSAQSQLASAENDLNNFIIRSDVDGVVYKTYKEIGETVRMNEMLVLLGEKTSRIIKMQVDQQDIQKIKLNQEVLFKTDVTGTKIYKATVARVYPLMNEADQTFRVDATFPDSLSLSFVHITVESNILIQEKLNPLVVPRKVLMKGDSLQVLENGEIKTTAVKLGVLTLDDAEILSGVNEQSEIVIPTDK